MNLRNKVALVTGGSSGIGQGAAIRMAQAGANIGVLARDKEEIRAVVQQIERETGASAVSLIADVSQPDQVNQAIERLIEEWQRLDVVFANAGMNGVWASLEDLTPDEWDQTLSVNLKGTFLTVKYALPYLTRNGGSIIVTSSVNGTRMFSNTGATAYACSKAGQVAFAKMAALELAEYHIRVNVICPGAIESEIEDNTERHGLDEIRVPVGFPEGKIPLTDGKPGTPDQVAELVTFLASDASSHITGTEIWIDGGQSLLQG